MNKIILVFAIFTLLSACNKDLIKYPTFESSKTPPAPDYSNTNNWAALPTESDMADLVPGKNQLLKNNQNKAEVDVFFIHPTIYTKDQEPSNPWNADVNNQELNIKTDESTIKYQSTVFNGSCKIYAPRYRQAHVNVYNSQKSTSNISISALGLAYTDVKKAFEYYLTNYNNGRSFVIGSHSQGTTHAIRLIKEFIDNKPLQKQMVAAYIVGMPVQADVFETIPVCESSDQTNCWVGWNTYAKGYYPPTYEKSYKNAINVNPLNWKTDNTYAEIESNKGGILKNYNKLRPELSDAQNHDGMLWINKPHFFGNFLINWKRYHVVDYNLFYLNIRENVDERVNAFLNK